MKDLFLTNYSEEHFVDHLKSCFERCDSFLLSVSFIKMAGLTLIKECMEDALRRGVKGKLITSTYQNFTDIPALQVFLSWVHIYPNFSCHIDFDCFEDNGYHSKGYIFEIDGGYEFLVGSTNITRFALLKNIEWNVSLTREKDSKVIQAAIKEFDYLFDRTMNLDENVIRLYTVQLEYAIEKWDMDYNANYENKTVMPNAMQKKALKELRRYRDMGVNKALIVAATASGKTYLAAFDARNFDAKRVLFIVHRDTILTSARQTFQKVFMARRTYGLFTGQEQDLDAEFIFATNTMMASHLDMFGPNEFDYIVFDECHHVTASTYQKIMNYFHPQFLLGLTATPERMDNEDVFGMFDKNVPYELRLREAIKNELIVPFKYYGVRDEFVNYSNLDKTRFLSEAYSPEHCKFVAEQIESHRPEGKLKCIAFCKSVEHARLMANAMSEMGYYVACLTGQNKTGERLKAYKDLQDDSNPLEIIFTIDILNEGVDIPAINMVLFLRPTDSQVIFIQQLGRGLRKCEGKQYLTVLDFIGNSYDRSIQIALALGSLSSTTYVEKALLTSLVRDDFRAIDLEGVEIHFDELSKDEILHFIEKTNFNRFDFLNQDYWNFKKFLSVETPPKHMDYLVAECAPDLMRFMKASMRGSKNKSYYNFLKKIDEEVPLFSKEQIDFINTMSEQLPLTRREEYLIIDSVHNGVKDLSEILKISAKSPRISEKSLKSALQNLIKQKLVLEDDMGYLLAASDSGDGSFNSYLEDLLQYGLERYETEFGEFFGSFKLYANYAKEKVMLELTGEQTIFMQGTKYDETTHSTYVFIGLKKDASPDANFAYKDRFLSTRVFQWESVNNTTRTSAEGRKLLSTEKVYLFVRKMESEDGVTLPFTYFGTGHFDNCRDSTNNGMPTLLFDILLDHPVPEQYMFDFQIPKDN